MSNVISDSIIVAAPADAVFSILADPRQHQRIDGSGTLRGNVTGPDRLSLDATFGMDMKQGPVPYSMRNKVVEFEEGRLIAWRHVGPHRWRYELEPAADGATRVTETWDGSAYGPAVKIFDLIGFTRRNRAGIAETLPRLKAAAESDVAAAG